MILQVGTVCRRFGLCTFKADSKLVLVAVSSSEIWYPLNSALWNGTCTLYYNMTVIHIYIYTYIHNMRLSMCTYTAYIYMYVYNEYNSDQGFHSSPIMVWFQWLITPKMAATGDGRGTVTRHLPIFCQFILEKGMLAQSVIVHRWLFVGEVWFWTIFHCLSWLSSCGNSSKA